jgi:hypothetical protein
MQLAELTDAEIADARAARSDRRAFAVAQVLSNIGDARLTWIVGAFLFVLYGWPLVVYGLPPLQDLPNHIATAHIIAHPGLYPEYTFNGLFKSNCLLTLWFAVLGGTGHGLLAAARAFTALTLAVNALALPIFVLRFAGRRHLPVAALFFWPLVHSFSLSMGFLNFTFAFGLSLILLALLDRQRERPTRARAAGIAALAIVVWYAHPFPIGIVGLLLGIHTVLRPTWRERARVGLTLLLPLAPAALLSLVTAEQHLVKPEHTTAAAATFRYQNPLELIAHLWMDVSGALTWRGAVTLIPAVLLPYTVWRYGWKPRHLFSGRAMVVLVSAYLLLPNMLSNWNYLNCRLVPFLWAGLIIRLPSRLSRGMAAGLALAALAFSLSLGADYAKLDAARSEFTAGIGAVPEHATLLPLLFKHRESGEFTATLTHDWGFYMLAKNTSAPLAFAVDRSHPIIYRDFPPTELIPPALDRFAERFATPALTCAALGRDPSLPSCATVWRDLWADFWRQAEPRFSHLLLWALPPEARELIPRDYHSVFAAGRLEILARDTNTRTPATSPIGE